MTWLKSNRWYLVALVVLLPAALLVALSTSWWSYADSQGKPITVRGSETVEYAGAEWSLLEWHSFSADSNAGESAELLPGTTLVTATIGVRPGSRSPSCEVELTDTAGERSWPEAGYSETAFEIRDDSEEYCSTDAADPYKLQVVFVVPDDAAEHPRLRLSALDELPVLLSFEL